MKTLICIQHIWVRHQNPTLLTSSMWNQCCWSKHHTLNIKGLLVNKRIQYNHKVPNERKRNTHGWKTPSLTLTQIHTYTYFHEQTRSSYFHPHTPSKYMTKKTANRIRNITEKVWSTTRKQKLQFKPEWELKCLENVQVKAVNFYCW